MPPGGHTVRVSATIFYFGCPVNVELVESAFSSSPFFNIFKIIHYNYRRYGIAEGIALLWVISNLNISSSRGARPIPTKGEFRSRPWLKIIIIFFLFVCLLVNLGFLTKFWKRQKMLRN